MQRTEAQIAASRVNGGKSRGPVTPEGKAISSRNAIKHGLLAGQVVLEGEREDTFTLMLDDLYEEFQPATPFEESLIQTMATARWRQERAWNIERVTVNRQMRCELEMNPALKGQCSQLNAIAFQRLSDDSRALDLVLRYESRHDRQYLRAHKRFLEVRAERLKQNPPPGPALVIPIDGTRDSSVSSEAPDERTRDVSSVPSEAPDGWTRDVSSVSSEAPDSLPPNEPEPEQTETPELVTESPNEPNAEPINADSRLLMTPSGLDTEGSHVSLETENAPPPPPTGHNQ